MAIIQTINEKLLLLLIGYLSQKARGDSFGIKEPFPESIYPIEGTSAQVTCVAFDSSGMKIPERIQFVRKDRFARYTNVTETENIELEEMRGPIDQGNQKLSVTMIIKNVSLNDDSTYGPLGRYECHAFAVGDPVERKHGFSVNVVIKEEIPSVAVSKFGLLRHGQDITIICSVTKGSQASSTALKRISWFKNGMLVESVRNPDPDNPLDRLRPLIIRDIGARDDGVYTCLLEVLLRNIKAHNVSDSSVITRRDNFGIVEPFPENIYPIEGTSAQVTCVAFDSSGLKIPERIQFVRKNKFAHYTNVTEIENIELEEMRAPIDQEGNQKLSVTMIIKNVSLKDDSTFGPLGRHECHAFAVGDPVERKHGFSVNVVRKDEIPSVAVSKFGLLQPGQDIMIICNMTEGRESSSTGLKRISWFKNGMLVESVRNPDPDNPLNRLRPLIIRDIGDKDDGVYTCLLEVLLRNIKAHSVLDSSVIKVFKSGSENGSIYKGCLLTSIILSAIMNFLTRKP